MLPALGEPEADRTEKRLGRHEPDHGRGIEQGRDADVRPFLVLHADTQPHVRQWASNFAPPLPVLLSTQRPGRDAADHPTLGVVAQHDPSRGGKQCTHPGVPLCENLERVLAGHCHDNEHLSDELVGHVLVEQIGHGVDEHPARRTPTQRSVHNVPVHREPEPRAAGARVTVALILLGPHAFQPLRHCQRIAVVGAGADLIAPGGRIPDLIGPLDRGRAHDGTTGRVRVGYNRATDGPTDSGSPSRQNRPSPVDQQFTTSSLASGTETSSGRTTPTPFPAF